MNKKAEDVLASVSLGVPEDFVFRSPVQRGRERSARAFKTRATCAFKRYRERAGIERPLTLHGLRHGFCTALAEAGKSAYVIKGAARHSHTAASMVYVDPTQDHLRAQVGDASDGRLNAATPPPGGGAGALRGLLRYVVSIAWGQWGMM